MFFSFSDENHVSKQKSPRWDAAFCGDTSGAILFAYAPSKGRQAYMGQVYGNKKMAKTAPESLFLLYDFRNCTSNEQNAISENILKKNAF